MLSSFCTVVRNNLRRQRGWLASSSICTLRGYTTNTVLDVLGTLRTANVGPLDSQSLLLPGGTIGGRRPSSENVRLSSRVSWLQGPRPSRAFRQSLQGRRLTRCEKNLPATDHCNSARPQPQAECVFCAFLIAGCCVPHCCRCLIARRRLAAQSGRGA